MDKKPRIYSIPFSSIYPLYVQKAENKGRTKEEVNQIIYWLTGHDEKSLKKVMTDHISLEDFYYQAPQLNPHRRLVTGMI